MKAEQRKELETNTLADKMGRFMQRVKVGQRRTFMMYFLAVAGLFVILFLAYRWWNRDAEARSMQWIMLYDGSQEHLKQLAASDAKDTPAGKAARLQEAWLDYWYFGVKKSGGDPRGALNSIKIALRTYTELVDNCKDDPTFEPQAMLGMAVSEESLAVEDVVHLKKAKTLYDELAKKYENTAEGKFAKLRHEILNDPTKNKALSKEYDELRRMLDVPRFIHPPLGGEGPLFPLLKQP